MPKSVDSDDAEDRLRRIEAITDTTLGELDVEELLHQLLERVRSILRADTATVLLLDRDGRHLVATASSGIEEEVRQGFRIGVGEGFAGKIAATRQALTIDQVDSTTVINPLLWRKGIRSLAGVPLITGGELLGVLHVGAVKRVGFTDQDLHLLRLAADRVALSTHAKLTRVEKAAASALQRSLLPARLPDVPGLELAARYAPGDGGDISGDWYDVFTLPSGWLCVAIGDVVGRGLAAATVMSRLRTATRAYALESRDPSEVLTKLDRHIRTFEPDTMATIAYAMWEPTLRRMHISLAGHLSPVVAPPQGPPAPADVPVDPPVGYGSGALRRRTTIIDVPLETLVLFYTDGLVERRNRSLSEGLALLADCFSGETADELCSAVLAGLLGSERNEDDVAVLAIRARELPVLDFEIDAVPQSLAEVRAALRRWLPSAGADENEVGELLVVVGEACANAIEHAYGPVGGTVRIRLERRAPDVLVTVSDEGTWREPRGRNRGKGTELMRKLADDLRFEHTAKGTTAHIRRRLAARAEESGGPSGALPRTGSGVSASGVASQDAAPPEVTSSEPLSDATGEHGRKTLPITGSDHSPTTPESEALS
ncbi:histidine kinase [Prauserella marina]|nr:SpoIIE family protein phosphatase [Prauserella marina]ASR38312.1 histidine kinase [Prauserella marina]